MRHDRHFKKNLALLLVLILTAVSSGAAFASTETAREWIGTDAEEYTEDADVYYGEDIPEATDDGEWIEEYEPAEEVTVPAENTAAAEPAQETPAEETPIASTRGILLAAVFIAVSIPS